MKFFKLIHYPTAAKQKAPKKRVTRYEVQVMFDGMFEDMIVISTTSSHTNKKDKKA
jgi:hypothetical protein